MKSLFLNDSVVLYHIVQENRDLFKFNHKKRNEYRCCRCRELGKERSITVVGLNDVVVGVKPLKHHVVCVFTALRSLGLCD